jgi:hypothetical protein
MPGKKNKKINRPKKRLAKRQKNKWLKKIRHTKTKPNKK